MKYIYGLVDPRTRGVRYIGQTDDLARRLQQHLQEKENTVKGEWIRDLKDQGFTPTIIRLATIGNGENVHHVEYRWIYFGRQSGWELVNTAGMKSEQYHSLQGYFERLIVEMEKPEGMSDRKYTATDVEQGILKNVTLFLEWFPTITSVGLLGLVETIKSGVFPASFCLLSTALYIFSAIYKVDLNSGKDTFFLLASLGGIFSIGAIVDALTEESTKSFAWLMGLFYLGMTVIVHFFLQGAI